ncbi:MAG: biopolymer transporter ExbD [Pseudomonadota bacterium]
MQLDVQINRRRKISMTSLIDVIFLLLLFFMLSSTFSRFSDVELQTSGGQSPNIAQAPPLFVKIDARQVSLNGQRVEETELVEEIKLQRARHDINAMIVSVDNSVSAQKFINVLTSLQALPGIRLQVVH